MPQFKMPELQLVFQTDQTTATALFSLAQHEIIQFQKRLHIFKGEREEGKGKGETERECQGGHTREERNWTHRNVAS